MTVGTIEEPVSRIAVLIGDPDSGKTTLFNALTGLHHKVGNYPGVTVEKKDELPLPAADRSPSTTSPERTACMRIRRMNVLPQT